MFLFLVSLLLHTRQFPHILYIDSEGAPMRSCCDNSTHTLYVCRLVLCVPSADRASTWAPAPRPPRLRSASFVEGLLS